jgi:hypothetical protein
LKVLVYHNRQFGPSAVYSTEGRPDEQVPASAHVPGGPFPVADAHVQAKGSEITWPDWAGQLAEGRAPFSTWTTEDVPDGTPMDDALSLVRSRTSERLIG